MRSLYNLRAGGYEVLQVRESPDPTPGPGEVLVRVARAGLNFSDLMARMGLYPEAPKPPMVMGYEAAGTVVALGPGVTGHAVGERVLALTRFGGQATHFVLRSNRVFPIPEEMSFDHAAALPVNYLTAFHILRHVAQLRPGDKVLIQMAAGGVGMAAIQLCRLVPNVEIFGTASAAKHAALRDAGVQHPIDYRSVDYASEIRRLTGGKGVQLILDPLGGRSWRKGYSLLAPTGHLVAFGFAEMVGGPRRSFIKALISLLSLPRFSPYKLMGDNRTISGVNMLTLLELEDLLRHELEALFALYRAKKISPTVDRVFPLDQAAEAHRYLQERKNVGKVLLDCS